MSTPVEYVAGTQPRQTSIRETWLNVDRKVKRKHDRGYLLLLPAGSSVRLVQEPRAKDWIHIDSYALDTDQQDPTWTTQTHKT